MHLHAHIIKCTMSIPVAVLNSHAWENGEDMQMQWQLPGFSEITTCMLYYVVFTGKHGLDAALITNNSSKI